MSNKSKIKKIIVGVSGSISAYKSADLVSQLSKIDNIQVNVVMTKDAQEFITPLTLQTLSGNPVIKDLYDEKEDWSPGHIKLADEADLIVVAPATSNIIAKFANGISNDTLSAIYLATLAPTLIAPAMNGKMWLHPATKINVNVLSKRGVSFIGPDEGVLACGYKGVGRLSPINNIINKIQSLI